MPKTLTESQVNRYKKDGVLFPIPVLSSDEVERYLTFTNHLANLLGTQSQPVEMSIQMHLFFRWAYDLATHPKVLDVVEDILGNNILIWGTTIFSKSPHDPAYVAWHRDGKYWWLDSTQVVTAWIALSNSSITNGCIHVVLGSHHKGILPDIESFAEKHSLIDDEEIAVDVNSKQETSLTPTPMILKPGEMSLHNVRIIHGSKRNYSDEKRVGFAIRYSTPLVKQVGQYSKAILARGCDTCGNFELIEPPVTNNMEEYLPVYREFTKKLTLPNNGMF